MVKNSDFTKKFFIRTSVLSAKKRMMYFLNLRSSVISAVKLITFPRAIKLLNEFFLLSKIQFQHQFSLFELIIYKTFEI